MNLLATRRATMLRIAKASCLGERDVAAEARAIVERANGHLFMAFVLIDEARRIARRAGRKR